MCKLFALAALVLAVATSAEEASTSPETFAEDDECLAGDSQCSLNALQSRAAQVASPSDQAPDAADLVPDTADLSAEATPIDSYDKVVLGSGHGHGGWSWGGDKIWGRGAGTESIHESNVGYYNAGMSAARGRCGSAGCALLINPVGHRTVNVVHIHEIHFKSYGARLKDKMESKVCDQSGWHGGGLPCNGKAAFFPGWPGVFSKALAYTHGNIAHDTVIAWPESCGGRGTIVSIHGHCSIEHQIRGDFNPRYR